MTERIVWVDLRISSEWHADVRHEGKWLTLYPARINGLPEGMEPGLRAYGVPDWDRDAPEADLGAMAMVELEPEEVAEARYGELQLGVQPRYIFWVAGLTDRDNQPCRILGTLELRRTEETHGCDHRQGVA